MAAAPGTQSHVGWRQDGDLLLRVRQAFAGGVHGVVVGCQVVGIQIAAVEALAAEAAGEVVRALALPPVPHHAVTVRKLLAAVAAQIPG